MKLIGQGALGATVGGLMKAAAGDKTALAEAIVNFPITQALKKAGDAAGFALGFGEDAMFHCPP